MKKHKKGLKLSRGQAARKALFRSLTRALVQHGSIETTEVKAKALEKMVAKMVKFAKDDSVNSRRLVYSTLGNDREVADEFFKLVKSNFKDKIAGYTRIVRLPIRRGDGTRLVRIDWVKNQTSESKKKVNSKKAKTNLKIRKIKSNI